MMLQLFLMKVAFVVLTAFLVWLLFNLSKERRNLKRAVDSHAQVVIQELKTLVQVRIELAEMRQRLPPIVKPDMPPMSLVDQIVLGNTELVDPVTGEAPRAVPMPTREEIIALPLVPSISSSERNALRRREDEEVEAFFNHNGEPDLDGSQSHERMRKWSPDEAS